MKFSALLMLLISCFYLYGQDGHPPKNHNYISLSVGLQTVDIHRPLVGFSFRHSISENWWFTSGFSYNSFEGDMLMHNELLHADSSIQIYRNQQQFNKSFLLNGGLQFYPIRYLKIRLDAVIGYSRNHISFTDNAKTYDSLDGGWVWNRGALPDRYPDLFNTSYQDNTSTGISGSYNLYLGYLNYLVTGATFSLGGCLPIANRWEIGLTYTTSFLRYTYLNNNSLVTALNYEGKTVYPDIENYIKELPSFNLWNHSLLLSVGFGF